MESSTAGRNDDRVKVARETLHSTVGENILMLICKKTCGQRGMLTACRQTEKQTHSSTLNTDSRADDRHAV